MTLSQKLLMLDPLGCLFIMSAAVCLLLAFQWGGQSKAWNSPTVIGLLVAFPLILGLFALAQRKQGEDAIFPPWLLKQRSILAGCLFSFFLSMPSYIVSRYRSVHWKIYKKSWFQHQYGYYIPIYFQAVIGSTATQSGTQYLALVIPQMFGVVLSGALVTAFGSYVSFETQKSKYALFQAPNTFSWLALERFLLWLLVLRSARSGPDCFWCWI